MNRTDRLYALVEALRARAPRPVRAAELARRFEVTTRTVERDLAALQQTGVPIWAQPSPEATAQVEEAIRDNRDFYIDYIDRNDQVTTRTVEPAALIGGRLGWYMLGFCRLRQDGRAFRLDRIKSARVTAERITPRPVEELLADDPIPALRRLGGLVNEE